MKAAITCEYVVKGATSDGRKSSDSGALQHNIDLDAPMEDLELYTDILELAFSHFWTYEGEKQCHNPFREMSISLKNIHLEYED